MPKSKPVKDARERQVKLDPTQSSKVKKSVKFPRAASPEPGPVSSKSQVRASEDATDDSQKSTSSSPSFKIVAGSYEKLLYGFEGFITVAEDGCSYHLKPVFIFPAHVSCIKAVAASPGGKWLATGSADEIVKVWDLRRRKELGGLMHHAGSITYLHFPSRSHLLSASEDGTLCIFRARDWAVLRTLKGHKGRVNCVATHPSGKVALSVGKDKTLRMWDLMRGKGSASTRLGKEGELVRWSVNGSQFCVQSQSTIDVYSTDMSLLYTITHPSRLHDVIFFKPLDTDDELLLAAAEDRKTSVYQLPGDSTVPKIIAEMIGHSNRVKAVKTFNITLPPAAFPTSHPVTKTKTLACTISSDGTLNIYDLSTLDAASKASDSPQKIEPVDTYDTKGTRLTCMTVTAEDIAGAGDEKHDGPDYPEPAEAEEESEDEDAMVLAANQGIA